MPDIRTYVDIDFNQFLLTKLHKLGFDNVDIEHINYDYFSEDRINRPTHVLITFQKKRTTEIKTAWEEPKNFFDKIWLKIRTGMTYYVTSKEVHTVRKERIDILANLQVVQTNGHEYVENPIITIEVYQIEWKKILENILREFEDRVKGDSRKWTLQLRYIVKFKNEDLLKDPVPPKQNEEEELVQGQGTDGTLTLHDI